MVVIGAKEIPEQEEEGRQHGNGTDIVIPADTLRDDRVWMVKGPAIVFADGGICHAIGADVSNAKINIRPSKIIPFEPDKNCTLRITFLDGGNSDVWSAGKNNDSAAGAGMSIWKEMVLSSVLKDDEKQTVMLVGDSDTGKSTLATLIANLAIEKGTRPCIIDGDIGQGDLAPPAAAGMACLGKQTTDLYNAKADSFGFIGNNSPAGFEQIVIGEIKSLLDKSIGNNNQVEHGDNKSRSQIIIINTDGYVNDGSGIAYKIRMAEVLRPDTIVCLERSEENNMLSETFRQAFPTMQVVSAQAALVSRVAKTRRERIENRLGRFWKYTGGSKRHIILKDMAEVKFLYRGRKFRGRWLKYRGFLRLQDKVLFKKDMVGMFVALGFADAVAGFGIVTRISSKIAIQTPVQNFDSVYLSNIRLSADLSAEIRIM